MQLCYCASIPSIPNRTAVLMLQHRRESFHPFNTARIVSRALQKSQLMVGHNKNLNERFESVSLSQRAGLLFPGEDAKILENLPASELPDQLVVPDGTWHHVKTLMRDIPRLKRLPRFCIAPDEPSRYRIRREPIAHGLSTLEAIVSALQAIEPENTELDLLLDTFEHMVDNQIKQGTANWRENQRRRRGMPNIPRALTGDLKNIVVAYGEQEPGKSAKSHGGRTAGTRLLYWAAIRPTTGERFQCAIDSPFLENKGFLERLRLSADELGNRKSSIEFRRSWTAFMRRGDRLVVLHPSTANLLRQLDPDSQDPLILKAVNVSKTPEIDHATEQCFPDLEIQLPTPSSRAQERLQLAVARVATLNLTFRQHSTQMDAICKSADFIS